MELIVELLSMLVRIIVVEILFGIVFYWTGWLVCKVVTFGRYPKPMELSNGKNRDTRVFLVGFIVCLGSFLSFTYWG